MAAPQTEVRTTPPYLPLKTLLGFLDVLRDTAIPHRIDSSVMGKYSGTIKTQLRTGLRFFDFIDDAGHVQPSLRKLIATRGTSEWQATFREAFFSAYAGIIGDLDLDHSTLQQLKERFRAAGTDGSVLIKAVRFYLAALSETGLTYSPYFKVRGLSTGVGNGQRSKSRVKQPKNTTRKAEPKDVSRDDEEDGIPQSGTQRFSLPIQGKTAATLIVPSDLTENEWKMLDLYIRMYFNWEAGLRSI